MKTLIKLFVVIFLICRTASAQTDVLIDPRDGKEYKTVQIDSQIWMAENLKYADTISSLFSPHIKEQHFFRTPKDYQTNPNFTTPFIYYYADLPYFGSKYGMLYNWEAAKNACPAGWHLPSQQEFEQLILIVGKGDKIKAKKELLLEGDSGFEALLAGYLISDYEDSYRDNSRFAGLDNAASFWSSTEKNKHHAYSMDIFSKYVHIMSNRKSDAVSIRCIKN